MLDISKGQLKNQNVQVVNNMQQVITEVCATSMRNTGTDTLYSEQKQDKRCKKLASQICHTSKNSSKSFTLSAKGVLQKHQYIHGLQHDITIAPHSLFSTILQAFHDSKVIKEPFVHLRQSEDVIVVPNYDRTLLSM